MGRVMMRAHSFTGGFRFLYRFFRLPIGVLQGTPDMLGRCRMCEEVQAAGCARLVCDIIVFD